MSCRQRFLAVALILAGPALAEDRALVIGNATYLDAAGISGADRALLAASALEVAGFTVVQASDLTAEELRGRLSTLLAEKGAGDRLVILISGHFAQSAGQTFFLGTDATEPDLATVAAQGVPVQSVLDIAATAPGGAVVLLGTEARRLPLGPGLRQGIGPMSVPQGVTVLSGDATRVAEFAAQTLPQRGQSLAAMVTAAPDLQATGYLSALTAFRPGTGTAVPPTPTADPDETLWRATRAIDTVEAYRAYLAQFPQGRYIQEANDEIARIQAEPLRAAREAEDALALSRDDRRAIQRALSLLGFDPKGIDGLFGNGSRAAITAWQKRFGHAQTGYLTRDQVAQLSTQADRRAVELEAEAARRRAEQEREDRQYWQDTGSKGDEAGLRAYLRRYPDGLYADLANQRIEAIEEERRARAAAQDRAAWDRARNANTVAAFRAYLSEYPQGAFAEQARARIEALTQNGQTDADRRRAQEAEAALGLSEGARRMIETRLAALNLNPGPADGTFTAETRRAIRRYQGTRNLPTTGFLDQNTVVSLLAGSVLPLGD